MKKFLFTLLGLTIIVLTVLKFVLPQFSKAQEERPAIGDNTAVPLSSLSEGQINAAIDNIAALNGGHGGSMVVRVTPEIIESPDMQGLFNKAVQRAESKGVGLIMQTDGIVNPASMARWINEAPGQGKIAIVVENEVNDKNNTGFPGSTEDYADYFVSFAQTVDNDRAQILMTNLNSTCPEWACESAPNWYQKILDYNPDAFRYMDGLAASSYGVPPSFDIGFEGVIGFVKELEFLANAIGIDPRTFPVYIIETGLQPDPNQMAKYGSSQKEFIKFAMQFWMQHPNIVSLNFFNGQGINPGWDFFAFMKPGEPIDPELITLFSAFTSRALVIDETGKIIVDTSKLFRCEDEDGNFLGYTVDEETCEKLNQIKKQAIFITRSRGTCSTTQQAMQPTPLRPFPCESCSDPLGPQTESCAAPFQVSTSGEWCLDDIAPCDGDYTKTYDWGGDVVIDFTETKVPFAGYGGSVNSQIDTEISPTASKYLADYFTGTLFYGDEEIDTSDPAKYSQEIFRKAGVFRKLAPQELQDIYKREMISRAKKSQESKESSPVSNYEVENPNYPECPAKTLIEFITGLGKKPLRKNYRTYNEYLTALEEWKSPNNNNGCWPRLWPAVPMFSLEDAPGQIVVSAHPPGKISGSPYRATFPHLARLYESSDKLHQLLTPIITTKMAEKAEVPEKIEVKKCETKSGGEGLITALGCIPVEARDVASWILKYAGSIAGGLAFLLMGYSAFIIMSSAGDPEKIALAKKILTAAIAGLLIIIFTTFILQLIAAKILKIPGFSSSPKENSKVKLASANSLSFWNPTGSRVIESPSKKTNPNVLLANAQASFCPSCQSQPKLLAQGGLPSAYDISIENLEFRDGIVHYGVRIKAAPGAPVRGHNRLGTNADNSQDIGPAEPGEWGYYLQSSDPNWTPFIPPAQVDENGNFSINVFVWSHMIDPEQWQREVPYGCTGKVEGGQVSLTNCASVGPPPPPAPGPVCQSPDSKKSCSYPKAIMDANPNDPICVSGSKNGVLYAGLDVNNYKAKISGSAVRALQRKYDKCMSECGDDPGEPSCASCDQCSDVKLSRWISIKTQIPWLEKIWDKTTNLPEDLTDLSKSGLFHIFTPANMKPFEPTKGKSPIAEYDFVNIWGGDGGGASPGSGWLYYPYLGGVQQAKKCISEQFLLPRELQLNQNLCPSILAGKSIYDTTAEENRRKGLCTTLNYEIDYRDIGVKIDENTKKNIIEKVQSSWPESLIKEEWNTVYQAARGRGWNPAFVIGLWIEESGASHFVQNGISQDAFGCNPTKSKDLTESLNCLFSRPYANENFKEFMLTYSEGLNHEDEQFCLNPNFPDNLQSWYNQLTK